MILNFDQERLSAQCQQLRQEVRQFLEDEIKLGTFDPNDASVGEDNGPAFAKRVAEKGWIGMTWPKRYGGQERSFLERFVVNEEMRVYQAPTRHFFVADRQSGPTLLKYASESAKQELLPQMVRGEICFCIGMSEPDSGSDLFASKAKATQVEQGWVLNGTKVWITNAHKADYMIGLFRTASATKENRRHGLTSFLVKMSSPGIQCNPIHQMNGVHDFNEVVFEDVLVPDACVIGEIDGAWKQATSELAYERSGPERFLETFRSLSEFKNYYMGTLDRAQRIGVGRLLSQLHTLRRMSISVAGMLSASKEPVAESAIVKDLGTNWEQTLPHRIRDLCQQPQVKDADYLKFRQRLDADMTIAPKLTIQGGTTEILRGIIARGLGLR